MYKTALSFTDEQLRALIHAVGETKEGMRGDALADDHEWATLDKLERRLRTARARLYNRVRQAAA